LDGDEVYVLLLRSAIQDDC